MGRFNLDDYSPVEERIDLFYKDQPEGRIWTSLIRLEPPLVVFRAEVYRNGEEDPWATGYAYEKEGEGHVNRTSYIENCETSAVGRALANAGYHGKRDGAPRPSREEMEKVKRMESALEEKVEKLRGMMDEADLSPDEATRVEKAIRTNSDDQITRATDFVQSKIDEKERVPA